MDSMKEKFKASYWYTYLTLGRYTKRRAVGKSHSASSLKTTTALPRKSPSLKKYRSMGDMGGGEKWGWGWERKEEVEFVRSSEAYNALKEVPYATI
ncbi:hypothetical protein HDU67_009078 [Dinochytrium kinnereticum]|nr:hypothetical protein HDU67_009078 [Dinochytrium kinnereticum]